MEFKIDWKIKNFEDLPKRKGQLLSSPTFVIDTLYNSQWALHLYPYGDNDGNGKFTALYLVRKSDDDYSEDIILDCQLSFVAARSQSFFETADLRKFLEVTNPPKTDLASWKTTYHTFRRGGRCGSQEFLEKEKISSFLEHGTLTIRCVFNCHQKDVDASMSGVCRAVSLIGTDKRLFDWIIEDFQGMEPGDKKVTPIKTASKDARSMTISLSMTSENKLILDVSPIDRKRIKRAFCFLSTGKDPDFDWCGESSVWFDEIKNDENWSFPLLYSKEELLKRQTNNLIHLKCGFEFSLGIEFEKVEYIYYIPVSDQKRDNDSCSIM